MGSDVFSSRLKELRNTKGMTARDMASVLGIAIRSYQRYEGGDREPDIAALIKLATFFDVSIDYLVGRTDNPEINT